MQKAFVGVLRWIRQILRFAAQHNIVAKTELYPLSESNKVFECLAAGEVRYRAVL